MQQAITQFIPAAGIAKPRTAVEPLIGLVRIHLPRRVIAADLFFIQVTQDRCHLHETQFERLPVIVGSRGIRHGHALAEVKLLTEVVAGHRTALHGRHAQQLARQLMIGHPVFAIEPEPAQVVECSDAACQRLLPQFPVYRLQAWRLLQARDQRELLTRDACLRGQTDTGIKTLQITRPSWCRRDALRQ
ncbi:hypothetical protein D3C80_754470 [compost metagenome]